MSMDTRIVDNGDNLQPVSLENFIKHLDTAATVWLGTIGKGDIIRQMSARGEIINVTTGDLQRAAANLKELYIELQLEKSLSELRRHDAERLRTVMLDCIGRPAGIAGPMLKDALDQT
jgi:hypothetical protein